jgi:polysaccharide pyruvyl transferase WcaK-like protein
MQKTHLVTSADRLNTHDSQRAWEFIEKQQYDLIVVGSDTVLQFLPSHFRQDSVPPYWLPPEIGCKKAMCAASAGVLTLDQLSSNQREACKKSINSFDLVSLRDDSTFALMKDLGLKDESKIEMVSDPTFAYEIDYTYREKLMQERNIDFSKPTVLLHLWRFFKPAKELAAYYKSKGFQVLLLGPAKYGDLCLTDISPFEWAGIFRDCRLVVTGRFHDTLFSLKNLTPVVSVACHKSVVTNNGLSKYFSLLKLFGLHNTNYIDGVGMDDVDSAIQITDNAMHNFNKQSVKDKLQQIKNAFDAFVDEIAGLHEKDLK